MNSSKIFAVNRIQWIPKKKSFAQALKGVFWGGRGGGVVNFYLFTLRISLTD